MRQTNSTEIEILPAGEGGPRHLDSSTVMRVQGIPFLAISEFIRAKLKTWVMYAVNAHSIHTLPLTFLLHFSRGEERDARDIVYALSRHWNRVDINRIPEQDMTHFVARYSAAAPAWTALKTKYDM